jgi:predicted lipid-binding transport protein (Tim44 family)
MILALGSRGVRSRSAPVRPAPAVAELPPVPVMTRRAHATARVGVSIGPLVGFVAAGLIGSLVFGSVGHGGEDGSVRLVHVVLGGLVLFLMIVRRRRAALAQPWRAARDVPGREERPPVTSTMTDDPSSGSDLDRGVRDIRRTDAGFDPTRFAGYTGMMFRDAQTAWMIRDITSLRHRLTPEMYGGLQAECDRLRSNRRSNRVEEIEINAEITEAWQEGGRDYVTAYIAGSMVDYTVDDVNDGLVDGSRTIPRDVQEFWTFTRPAGLNFWMLSAIQTS